MKNLSENAYNRAGLARPEENVLLLNGSWEFDFDREDEGIANNYQEREDFPLSINVPYVYESKLSGICDTSNCIRVWYRRAFNLPEKFDTSKGRVLIHFDAVDYECSLWVNSVFAGSQWGGYIPCVFDITKLVDKTDNTLVVSAYDDTANPLQPTGKQTEKEPYGCLYTHCTGIWQSVWLEYVPNDYVKSCRVTPDVKNGSARFDVETTGAGVVKCKVYFSGNLVAEKETEERSFNIKIDNPVLWDIGAGNLYDVKIIYGEDVAYTYFGMREIKAEGNKLYLNGKPLFMRLVLDQGYYPDGIYTSSSPDDYYRDIDLCQSIGFNGARMHMKVFEPGFIRAADKLGYILWGEFPNWGLDIANPEANAVVMHIWKAEIERDYNHPSIIGWCPFNEAGDGDNTCIVDTCDYTREVDKSRLIIDTSGWVHKKIYDIFDVHDYDQDPASFESHYAPLVTGEGTPHTNSNEFPYDGKSPYFVSEFGGAYYSLDNAVSDSQDSGNGWGYGEAPKGEIEFLDRLKKHCVALINNDGVCGYCYTQFTDVMQEQNGLYTYDRRPKFKKESLYHAITGE